MNLGGNLVDFVGAPAGHPGFNKSGSDGYSGGGAYNTGAYTRGYDGGSDGGDAECGGTGTGEDVTSFTLLNYQISPGSRGHFYSSLGDNSGGGGGGVLVDGAGPGVG